MFESNSTLEFYQDFKCEEDCKNYLVNLKWREGFRCRRCNGSKSWKGRTVFHRRCAGCGYDESCTAYTIFNKIKFPLLKAFGMVFQIVNSKVGRSTVDLSDEFEVVQSTAWLFKKKIQDSLGVSCPHNMGDLHKSDFALDSVIIMHRPSELNGFQRMKVTLEKTSIGFQNVKLISGSSQVPDLESLEFSKLVQGKFKEPSPSMLLWNFKRWLTGTHHHCSPHRIDGYFNEFLFRQNHRQNRKQIWHLAMKKAVFAQK